MNGYRRPSSLRRSPQTQPIDASPKSAIAMVNSSSGRTASSVPSACHAWALALNNNWPAAMAATQSNGNPQVSMTAPSSPSADDGVTHEEQVEVHRWDAKRPPALDSFRKVVAKEGDQIVEGVHVLPGHDVVVVESQPARAAARSEAPPEAPRKPGIRGKQHGDDAAAANDATPLAKNHVWMIQMLQNVRCDQP